MDIMNIMDIMDIMEKTGFPCLLFTAAAAKSLSRVQLLATPWTAAHQAPPSMGFSLTAVFSNSLAP